MQNKFFPARGLQSNQPLRAIGTDFPFGLERKCLDLNSF